MDDDRLRCHCGARCSFAESYPELLSKYPCSGAMGCCEEYPGVYIHFCDAHGHPDDWRDSFLKAGVDDE